MSEQVREIDLNKYNNLLTSGGCYTKDPNNAQILALFGVVQKIVDESNKTSEKSNGKSTKGEIGYTRDLPSFILEDPKGCMGHAFNVGK